MRARHATPIAAALGDRQRLGQQRGGIAETLLRQHRLAKTRAAPGEQLTITQITEDRDLLSKTRFRLRELPLCISDLAQNLLAIRDA